MSQIFDFNEVARLPAPGDNTAIATRRLNAGTVIVHGATRFNLAHTILEGHRFAVEYIGMGQPLLSWGLSFGLAIRPIEPGAYVCNAKILSTLRNRSIDFTLPPEPNFRDQLEPYTLDVATFHPGSQVPRYAEDRYFAGYQRSAARGVGTRNYIVILGTTSRTSSYARALEERLQGLADGYPTIDGIVAVTHTEGGSTGRPNNLDFLLRTLGGFIVHPNVGAVLAVDQDDEAVTNDLLRRFMETNGYPLAEVPHRFFTLGGGFQEDLEQGAAIVRGWLGEVGAVSRTPQPLSQLKIALQCGGSDAFSGVSGNPLAAWVAGEVIRYGGSANLAETDELIGAEHYVLQNVRDLDTAQQFLRMIEQFRERLSWHGHTAEGNPSGGNNFRGLYNIAIKSIGAAMKRNPDVRLDYVIDYSEPMTRPGYYFMNSPGNDLESIAGQVASGCNMIFFVTGNGSITNFPFVPTIKIVTTTGRYQLLSKDMDVNAGAYLDGTPMDELGRAMLELTVDAAAGRRTVGEKAAHSQVSIWRNWMQRDRGNLVRLQQQPEPAGEPLPIRATEERRDLTFTAIQTERGYAADQIGLIMPTSLCAGQIARKIAARLNEHEVGRDRLTRFVALPHTEGCGASGGSSEVLYTRTLLGHLANPLVGAALLLEHGCEKTHNDYFRHAIADLGMDPGRFGWASVQADGGIDLVMQKAEHWARATVAQLPARATAQVGLGALRVGLSSLGPVTPEVADSLAQLTCTLVGAGATVVVPETATILSSATYLEEVLGARPLTRTLAYGQAARIPGFHVMEAPTEHWVETLTGMAATGVEMVLAHTTGHPLQGHRMVPLLQVTADAATQARFGDDLDLSLDGDPARWLGHLLEIIIRTASRTYSPRLYSLGYTDFQFTRGPLGVSM
ncbi:MAG TPA: UxaA family hydrolase [Chloroflexota bacterium]|nr:UxaA family hydrolase [Chloroflexota bacterium]